jgi:hypothetical protein
MKRLIITLFFIGFVSSIYGQAAFRFYVFDKTKTEKLDYEYAQDITIYYFEGQKPRLVFYTEYRIYGINQIEFTYQTERFHGDISVDDYARLLGKIRKLDLKALDTKKVDKKFSSSGWIKIDRKNYSVSAAPFTKTRKEWQAILDEFLNQYAPKKKRKIHKRTVQGDFEKPMEIEFEKLIKDPKKYDGKRIRIKGYYRGGFEESSFSISKKERDDRGNLQKKRIVWLGSLSTFADLSKFSDMNNGNAVVEGTFDFYSHGHLGLFMGTIQRLTLFKKQKNKNRTKAGI